MRDALRAAGLDRRDFKPGQIWIAKDENFEFKEVKRGSQRTIRDTRRGLVVDSPTRCADSALTALLIVPLSSQVQYATEYRLILKVGQGGLTKDTLVLADEVQPVSRHELIHLSGTLLVAEFEPIQAILASNLGLL